MIQNENVIKSVTQIKIYKRNKESTPVCPTSSSASSKSVFQIYIVDPAHDTTLPSANTATALTSYDKKVYNTLHILNTQYNIQYIYTHSYIFMWYCSF